MKTYLLFKIGIVLVLALGNAADAAEFQLIADRTVVEEGKSLQLSFTYSEETRGESPDFSVISDNFDVLSISPSSQRYNINGKSSVVNQWTLFVIPKKRGSLLIPPIEFKGLRTEATRIEVKPRGSLHPSKDVFLETIIDKSSAYIGEHIKLSYRLYYDTNIDNPQTDQLSVDTVKIEEMPTNQFRRRVDGRLYNVAEFNYLLKPEQDGVLIIPSTNWRIRINKGAGQSIFDHFGRFEIEQLRSQEKVVRIKPIPSSFPKDTPWLPASSLSLEQNWGSPVTEMEVGVPNTRTVVIKADGLSSDMLPVLQNDYSDIDLKIYAETPELEDDFLDIGATSKSTQSAAVIVNKEGRVELTEQKLAWWNTETDSLEFAIIPAQTIVTRTAMQGFENDKLSNFSSAGAEGQPAQVVPTVSDNKNRAPDMQAQHDSAGSVTVLQKPNYLIIALVLTNLATLAICFFLYTNSKTQNAEASDKALSDTKDQNLKTILEEIGLAEKREAWSEVHNLITQLLPYLSSRRPLTTKRILGLEELKSLASHYDRAKLHDHLIWLEASLFSRPEQETLTTKEAASFKQELEALIKQHHKSAPYMEPFSDIFTAGRAMRPTA